MTPTGDPLLPVDCRLSGLPGGLTKKKIRAQNKYDHRSGRGGYKKEEEKLRRELGREPTQWDRADMWCNIRRDKQGSSTQEVDHVVQKIVTINLIFVTY